MGRKYEYAEWLQFECEGVELSDELEKLGEKFGERAIEVATAFLHAEYGPDLGRHGITWNDEALIWNTYASVVGHGVGLWEEDGDTGLPPEIEGKLDKVVTKDKKLQRLADQIQGECAGLKQDAGVEETHHARDFDSVEDALAKVHEFLGAEWYVRKGDNVTVYWEEEMGDYVEATLVKARGLYHWPANWSKRKVKALPKGAIPINVSRSRETREAPRGGGPSEAGEGGETVRFRFEDERQWHTCSLSSFRRYNPGLLDAEDLRVLRSGGRVSYGGGAQPFGFVELVGGGAREGGYTQLLAESAGTVYRDTKFGQATVDFWERRDNQVGRDLIDARATAIKDGKVYEGYATVTIRTGGHRPVGTSRDAAIAEARAQAIANMREREMREEADTNWAVEWINPTTKKRQIYLDDMSQRQAEIEARTLRMHHPNADVRAVRRGYETRQPLTASEPPKIEAYKTVLPWGGDGWAVNLDYIEHGLRAYAKTRKEAIAKAMHDIQEWKRGAWRAREDNPRVGGPLSPRGSEGAYSQVSAREDSDAVPWVKIARDPEKYAEGMKRAKEIGPIDGARQVYDLLSPALSKEDQEVFLVVLLDVRQQCRGVAEVARGGRSRVSVDRSDVARVVSQSGAESFVIVHNHPTGDPSPSSADKTLTTSIQESGDGIDVPCIDHVIIGMGKFYSFAEGKVTNVR